MRQRKSLTGRELVQQTVELPVQQVGNLYNRLWKLPAIRNIVELHYMCSSEILSQVLGTGKKQ